MSNEKFPEMSGGWYEITLLYDPDEVHEWFKRCMEDFPIYPVLTRGHPWTHREYNAWFKKWFSQFMKKCENV